MTLSTCFFWYFSVLHDHKVLLSVFSYGIVSEWYCVFGDGCVASLFIRKYLLYILLIL